MVERKLINKFLNELPKEVNSCHIIKSYYITNNEAKLLNEINIHHTNLHYGSEGKPSLYIAYLKNEGENADIKLSHISYKHPDKYF